MHCQPYDPRPTPTPPPSQPQPSHTSRVMIEVSVTRGQGLPHLFACSASTPTWLPAIHGPTHKPPPCLRCTALEHRQSRALHGTCPQLSGRQHLPLLACLVKARAQDFSEGSWRLRYICFVIGFDRVRFECLKMTRSVLLAPWCSLVQLPFGSEPLAQCGARGNEASLRVDIDHTPATIMR